MAKRFTETSKWDLKWFRQLPPKLKCAWFFLVDKCDHAGIWDIDTDSMSHFIGETVTLEELESSFNGKLAKISLDKLFIPDFIEFQYGELNSSNRVHKSVLHKLEKEGANKVLLNPLEGCKDKDKDKDKDLVKEKDKDKEAEISKFFDLWNSFTVLPKAIKLTSARKKKIAARLTEASLEDWKIAITMITESKFLLGDSKEGWKADIDWLIANEDNRHKILEGKYKNKTNGTKAGGVFNHATDQLQRIEQGKL